MTKNVICINAKDTILDAIKTFKEKNISGAPVLNDKEELIGIISDSDILKLLECYPFPKSFSEPSEPIEEQIDDLRKAQKLVSQKKVEEVMSKYPITTYPDADVSHVAAIMWLRKINRLPVIDEKNKVVGIITRADVLKAL